MTQTKTGHIASDDPRHQFHELTVYDVIRETADATSYVFDIPKDLADLFEYKPGQFLTFEVPWEDFTIKRCYSLSSAPNWGEKPKVTVKRIDEGRMSNWMNDNLATGNPIRVMPPAGAFVLHKDRQRQRPLSLFAGGSGITPVISLLKQALRETERAIALIYANQKIESVIFRAELDAIAARYSGRFTLTHHLDDDRGFLSQDDIKKRVATRLDSDFYICGPTPFMETVERALEACPLAGGDIHIERFLSATDPDKQQASWQAPSRAPAAEGTPDTITITLEGSTHQVDYRPEETVLQAAIRAGLDVPFSCQDGYCSCCMAKLRRGEVFMTSREALTDGEIKEGWVLTCQARPTTSICEVEYED